MNDLIADYAAATYAYNGISADRQRQQPKVLRRLAESADKPLLEVDGSDLRGYLATRLTAGVAPTTLGKELKMIRPFYAWLYQEKLITAERLLDLREVKPPRGAYVAEPRPYNDKEISRFWRDVDRCYPWNKTGGTREEAAATVKRWEQGNAGFKTIAAYAHRLQVEAVIALALYGGIRQNEIYRLEVEEMHHENAYVLVRGARKNRDGQVKTRVVPFLAPAMRTAIGDWLEFRDRIAVQMGPLTHDRPWLTLARVNHATNAMSKRKMGLVMCSAGPWQFHRLRHTAATEMLRSGMALEVVRQILGHADIQMTLRYAKLLTDDILKSARGSERALAGRMERLRAAGGA